MEGRDVAFKKKWIVDLPPELWYKLENMKKGRTREELLRDLLETMDKDTWKLIEELRALNEQVVVLKERIRALEAENAKLRERLAHIKMTR